MKTQSYRHFVDVPCSEAQAKRWADLSSSTIVAARLGKQAAINNELKAWAEAASEGPFRSVYWYWMGTNMLGRGDTQTAEEYLRRSLQHAEGDGSICSAHSIEAAVHERLAALYISQQNLEAGLEQYSAMLSLFGGRHPRITYLAGQACEAAGQKDLAINYWLSIADPEYRPNTSLEDYRQLARRNVDRLKKPESGYELNSLVQDLLEALLTRDDARLRRLASSTHFSVGLGCHSHFVEREQVIEQLVADLRRRHIYHVKTQRNSDRVMVETAGWCGKWFQGNIRFELRRFGSLWQWTSVSIHGNPHMYMERLEKHPKETNQPLPFSLKAPWDRGNNADKTFMAGGLGKADEAPIFVARGIVEIARWIPIPFIHEILQSVSVAYDTLSPAEVARQAAMALRPCGFGLRGFYYNAIASHTGADAFAIDFSDYDTFIAASEFWPVLAAVDGRVVFSLHTIPNDSHAAPNLVEIISTDASGNRFASRYLHLAQEARNPFLLAGTFVRQGTPLGRMQNTGNSAFPHLHFSIHNQMRPHPSGSLLASGEISGASVRPTPMDGFTLGDGNEGSCVLSSNGGLPLITVLKPLPLQTIHTSIRSEELLISVSGGALPLTIEWTSDRELHNPISHSDTGEMLGHHVFQVPGPQLLRVTVTDALGRTDSRIIPVDVVGNPAQVEIIRPEDGERIASNDAIILHGRTMDFDLSGRLPEEDVQWYLDGSTTVYTTGHRGIIPGADLTEGTHTIRFVGMDDGTPIGVDRTFEITASVSNRLPIVRIIKPADDWLVYASNWDPERGYWYRTLHLLGEAEDPEDGSLSGSSLEWSLVDSEGREESIGIGTERTYNFPVRDGMNATYDIILAARDSQGAIGHATRRIRISVFY
jgi:tetratricopeptide (TPR) repeat protein